MEGILRRLVAAFNNVLAFVATVIVGIAFGCFYCATEVIEDKLKPRHHSSVKHSGPGGQLPPGQH